MYGRLPIKRLSQTREIRVLWAVDPVTTHGLSSTTGRGCSHLPLVRPVVSTHTCLLVMWCTHVTQLAYKWYMYTICLTILINVTLLNVTFLFNKCFLFWYDQYFSCTLNEPVLPSVCQHHPHMLMHSAIGGCWLWTPKAGAHHFLSLWLPKEMNTVLIFVYTEEELDVLIQSEHINLLFKEIEIFTYNEYFLLVYKY